MITWCTEDLTVERCASILGDSIVMLLGAFVPSHAANLCRCRAEGAWTANDREHYAAWRSLRAHFLAKAVQRGRAP